MSLFPGIASLEAKPSHSGLLFIHKSKYSIVNNLSCSLYLYGIYLGAKTKVMENKQLEINFDIEFKFGDYRLEKRGSSW